MIMQDHVTPLDRVKSFDPDRPMSWAERQIRLDLQLALDMADQSARLLREINHMGGVFHHHQGVMAEFDRGGGV